MRFLIALEPGSNTAAWGVTVPDLPGCHSAGGTIDEAVSNAREAIALWCQTVLDDGGVIPVAASLGGHQANPEFNGCVWREVEVPVAWDDGA